MDSLSTVADLHLTIEVAQCLPSTSVKEVRKLLQESKIGSIVVTEKKKVMGIFTERDYLMKIAGDEAKKQDRPVSDFMTANPKSVPSTATIVEVLDLMNLGKFRHVVVINEKSDLVGVISVKDLMTYLQTTITDLEKSLKDLAACIV